MISEDLAKRISALLKNYAPAKQVAFRKAVAVLTDEALANKAITPHDADLVANARICVENWAMEPAMDGEDSITRWMEFYRGSRETFPSSLFQAVLDRFPKGKSRPGDWTPFILDTTDKNLVRVLVKRHLIKAGDLKRIAKSNPRAFYSSAALDLMVERRNSFSRDVWASFSEGVSRPPGLLRAEDAIVRCFAFDKSGDAAKWFALFLGSSVTSRDAVLDTLLTSSGSAFRLARQLSAEMTAPSKRKTENRAARVVIAWVAVCVESLNAKDTSSATALLVLSFFRLAASADATRYPEDVLSAFGKVAVARESAVLEALQHAESEGLSGSEKGLLVVSAKELYQGVHAYLERLPTGIQGNDDPERSVRFERYMGRKEVIDGLLRTIDQEIGGEGLRDAIEVVLFNAGVRPSGEAGNDVIFDHHLHQPTVAGILPGDPVTVLRPGRTLGSEKDAIVLTKARVGPRQARDAQA